MSDPGVVRIRGSSLQEKHLRDYLIGGCCGALAAGALLVGVFYYVFRDSFK